MKLFSEEYLAHHGIQGQKWGVRRFQNADGSLTPRGKKRAAKQYDKALGKAQKETAKKLVRFNDAKYTSASVNSKKGMKELNLVSLKAKGANEKRIQKAEKEVQEWLEKSKMFNESANKALADYKANKAKVDKILQEVRSDPAFVTYNERRGTTTSGAYVNGTEYGRTRVKSNTERNAKKANKKNNRYNKRYDRYGEYRLFKVNYG